MNAQVPSNQWFRVEVSDSDGQIVAIESEMLAGRDIGERETRTIEQSIAHLQAFIGVDADEKETLRTCGWEEIEEGSGVYNTCKEGEEFHLSDGLELWPFCHWCGGLIEVGIQRVDEPPECTSCGKVNYSDSEMCSACSAVETSALPKADESAWLVERSKGGRPHWIAPFGNAPNFFFWTNDADQAQRFATKQEADVFIAEKEITKSKATKHLWLGPSVNGSALSKGVER